MPVAPNVGVLAQLGMNTTTTTTPGAATEAYEFESENLALDQAIIDTAGIRGGRNHVIERVRAANQHIGGSINIQPTYNELLNLLPRIVGAISNQAGYDTFSTSDTVAPVYFQTIVDRVAKVYSYVGCKVGSATFRSSQGGPLSLSLEIEALQESIGNSGTFAALTIDALPPLIHTDSVLTLGGTAYQVFDWECSINWHLDTGRFVNSTTRTDLISTDLTVTTHFTLPYTSDTLGLYLGGSAAGVTGNINFTSGGAGGGAAGKNLQFTFANLLFPPKKSPTVGGKGEIHLALSGEARKSSTTLALVVSLDHTT